MAVALTPFSGFCGFRPPTEIASFLATVPEFAAVIGSSASSTFQSTFTPTSTPSEDAKKAGLKSMFSALMNADAEKVKSEVAKLVARLAGESGTEAQEERELVKTLNGDFEGDVGIFCTFVLNIVHLQPGEAVFLKADEPHAYLDGGQLIFCSGLDFSHLTCVISRHHGVHGHLGFVLLLPAAPPRR